MAVIDGVQIKPIETVYNGYRFRSRLEARWAVFFDSAGIEWSYEPEGFVLPDGSWYLPDFFITLSDGHKWFVEVKGNLDDEVGLRKANVLDDDPPWGALGCMIFAESALRKVAQKDLSHIEQIVYCQRLNISCETFNRCRLSALQARFEHGEHGASKWGEMNA